MKARILSLSILSTIGVMNTAYAEKDTFVGIELGSATTDLNVKSEDGYELIDDKEDSTYLGFRLGTYLQPNIRVSGVIGGSSYGEKVKNAGYRNSENIDMDVNVIEFMGYIDYVHSLNESFSLFVGPHVGFTSISIDYDYEYNDGSNRWKDSSETESKSSLSYGAQTGAIFKPNDRFSLEAGVRYTVLNYDEHLDEDWYWGWRDVEFDVKAKDMTKFYLSANYHF